MTNKPDPLKIRITQYKKGKPYTSKSFTIYGLELDQDTLESIRLFTHTLATTTKGQVFRMEHVK